MSEDTEPDDSRRTFLKGVAATGVAATGLAAFSGGAAAQQVRTLRLGDVQVGSGLLTVQLQNINVLRNVNIEDVVVTVIGGDVRILEEGININFEEEVIEINLKNIDVDVDVLNDALNNNNVQVAVAVLGDADNVLAAGDTIA